MKRWNASVFCETYKTLTDKKSPYERRFGTPFDGLETPVGAENCSNPISAKDKSSASIENTDASRSNHRIRSEFWRWLDQRFDHRGLARH